MRINKYLALGLGISRRKADEQVNQHKVYINKVPATPGDSVSDNDTVLFDGKKVEIPAETLTVILNKPVGYVCSRKGQGSKTVYDLLPKKFHQLKPAGRLDKDSSGIILLTNDGNLSNRLTHPRYSKKKTYVILLDKNLSSKHQEQISQKGVKLEDGNSKLGLQKLDSRKNWLVTMNEGKNRQIRRTFQALEYKVSQLHRTNFGSYSLKGLKPGEWMKVQ